MIFTNDFKRNMASFNIDDILKPKKIEFNSKYSINDIINNTNFSKKIPNDDQSNKNKNFPITNTLMYNQNKTNIDNSIRNQKVHKCDSSSCFKNHDQIPVCLRGVSNEQMHLANLFNTLIHHKKCRRTRTVFTDAQLIGLEKRFDSQKYLSTSDRIELASTLGLSQLQVKTWYQNRRMKWKKQVLKEGSSNAPTKPKGRPKKNSIPSLSEILQAKETGLLGNDTGSSIDSNNQNGLGYDDDDDDDDGDDVDEDDYSISVMSNSSDLIESDMQEIDSDSK